ncbi:MAG: SDR family oxidoreductase [Gammaproteobacteria bacterium]
MDLGISGRRAIVCASSRGLGKACAMALARNGVDVTVNGRNEATLQATADEIRRTANVAVTPVVADVSTAQGQAALLEACPTPDILVNNNGGPPFRDFRELSRDALLEGVTMNMVTPIELIKSVIDPMIERKFGRIVNITSVSIKMPVAGLDLSSGARAGLTAFVAGISRTVAQHNVTINGLLPGFFDTDRLRGGIAATANMLGKTEAEQERSQLDQVPAERFGQPAEFGQTCAFLCSEHASYLTGQNILLDGGLYRAAF